MSLLRELVLRKHKGVYRLECYPATQMNALLDTGAEKVIPKPGVWAPAQTHARCIHVSWQPSAGGNSAVVLHTGEGFSCRVEWDAAGRRLVLDRTRSCPPEVVAQFDSQGKYACRYEMALWETGDGKLPTVDIWADETSVELFCGGKVMSALVFSPPQADGLEMYSETGGDTFEVRRVKPLRYPGRQEGRAGALAKPEN